jgi:hypothetical protein
MAQAHNFKDLVIVKSGVARFDPGVVWRWEFGPAALETVAGR